MSIRVALHHRTHYSYDRPINLGAQTIRLRPAAHSRTPVASYSLKIEPAKHFINWQQDPSGNYLARVIFPEKVTEFTVEVDLVADMTVINPFDFFLEPEANELPWTYDESLSEELAPYLDAEPAGPHLQAFLATVDTTPRRTIDFLVDINRQVQEAVRYLI
ncbi:MAG: IMP dehydrogenase, partial [Planctomycetales bacterium]|nr:IMP dehydrogenase [Planctomycetales bacterium]